MSKLAISESIKKAAKLGLAMTYWIQKKFSCFLNKGNAMPEANTQTELSVQGTDLKEYLKYYSSLKKPGYAVMVTGAWGVGKTYQVKQAIHEKERYFVSLYGLDSVESIHDAVLRAFIGGWVGEKGLSFLSENTSDSADAIISKTDWSGLAIVSPLISLGKAAARTQINKDKIIVFDDLERSHLWENKKNILLGAINHYVEHQGFRVVVICHDEKISDEISEVKEKVFGHTIQVKPDTSSAFDAFIEDIQGKAAKKFIFEKRLLIEEIWTQSQQTSLRILRHIIHDVARLHQTLEDGYLAKEDGINRVLRFFCALAIEVRAGRLNEDLLHRRREIYTDSLDEQDQSEEGKRKKDHKKIINDIYRKYEQRGDIFEEILSNDIVNAMLINGRFDKSAVTAWLKQSPDFEEPSEIAPWRVVRGFYSLDDSTVSEGVARMQTQFNDRSVTDMGEFLHIAALRLVMVEVRMIDRSFEEEIHLIKAYIDDLLRDDRLPLPELTNALDMMVEELLPSYGGYGYSVTDTTKPYFDEVKSYIRDRQNIALQKNYPEYIENILICLKDDPASLLDRLTSTPNRVGTLSRTPILAQIPINQFLDSWLEGHPSQWLKTAVMLELRYEVRGLEDGECLRDELDWLIKLEKEMDARIKNKSGFDALRLRRIKPQKIFDKAKEIKQSLISQEG